LRGELEDGLRPSSIFSRECPGVNHVQELQLAVDDASDIFRGNAGTKT
jgi:hypothetical protein